MANAATAAGEQEYRALLKELWCERAPRQKAKAEQTTVSGRIP